MDRVVNALGSMARPLRIQGAGLSYHVTARGNGRMAIFLDDQDRHTFLELLARVVESHGLECHAYCMMTNHYHLVATTTEANLSKAVKQLDGPYGQWWNRRHGHVGHVFQGRFKAQVVQDDTYLLTVCRYVVLNPVRAHLVHAPEQWRWSSHKATAGLATVPPFLRPETLWRYLGDGDLKTAVLRYREFVRAPEADSVKIPADPVVGDLEFVDRFKMWRARASREVPRRERQHPVALETLFAGAFTRATRNAQAARAHALGYRLAEIARHLDVHPTTVSKMVRAATPGGQIVKEVNIQDLSRPDPVMK